MAQKRATIGSIRERQPGVWQVRVSAGRDLTTGQRRYVSKTIHGTETQATKAAAQLYGRVADGRQRSAKGTVAELLEEWLAAQESRGRAPKTIHEYRRLAKAITTALGPVPLRKLTGADIDRFYGTLSARGLKPNTIRHHHTTLAAALRQGVKWEWLDSSPADHATAPGAGQAEPKMPTPDEVRMLIKGAESQGHPDLAALVLVAAATGCRRGELCALRFSDVDFDVGRLLVRQSVSDTPGHVELRSTKTNRVRRLALDPLSVAAFEGQLARAEERCEVLGVELDPEAFVWSQEADHSEPWRPDRITDTFRGLRDSVGLKHIRFHYLRHFAATMMLAGGVDVRTAAGRLGHAQPSVTLKTYAHVVEVADRSAAELMGRILGP